MLLRDALVANGEHTRLRVFRRTSRPPVVRRGGASNRTRGRAWRAKVQRRLLRSLFCHAVNESALVHKDKKSVSIGVYPWLKKSQPLTLTPQSLWLKTSTQINVNQGFFREKILAFFSGHFDAKSLENQRKTIQKNPQNGSIIVQLLTCSAFSVQFCYHAKSPLTPYISALCAICARESLKVNKAKWPIKNSPSFSRRFDGKTLENQAKTVQKTPQNWSKNMQFLTCFFRANLLMKVKTPPLSTPCRGEAERSRACLAVASERRQVISPNSQLSEWRPRCQPVFPFSSPLFPYPLC